MLQIPSDSFLRQTKELQKEWNSFEGITIPSNSFEGIAFLEFEGIPSTKEFLEGIPPVDLVPESTGTYKVRLFSSFVH